MSLIRCAECGGNVSDKAVACPHCGAPIEVSVLTPIETEDEPLFFDAERPDEKRKRERYKPLLFKAISDYEKSIATIILLCIQNLDFELGIQKLTQILTGKQTKFITDYGLNNNPAFSLLKQYSRKEVKEVIEILGLIGYIQQEDIGWNRNVLCLTEKAYEFLDGREDFEGSFIDALIRNDFIELNDNQVKIYEELRAKRYSIAKEKELPAYTICNDTSLRLMAFNSPSTKAELLKIKGIGDSFIEKYGDAFIHVLDEFRSMDGE